MSRNGTTHPRILVADDCGVFSQYLTLSYKPGFFGQEFAPKT